MSSSFEFTNTEDTIISFQLPYLGMEKETSSNQGETTQIPMQTQIGIESNPPVNPVFTKPQFNFGQQTSGGAAAQPAFGCMGNMSSKKVEPGFPAFMASTSCIPKVQYYTFNPQTGYKPVDIPIGLSGKPEKKILINSLYDELKKIRGQIESLTKSTDEIYHIIRYLNDN